MMEKRFIVLIDFSKYSENLIKYAHDWSKETTAKILLVHQVNVLMPALADANFKQKRLLQAQQEALARLKLMATKLIPATYQIDYLVTDTPLRFTIKRLLGDSFDNLVFVGLKGNGLLKKLFLGSVALDVINTTEITVVAMPTGVEQFLHDKIFIAVNPIEPLNIEALNKFLRFLNTSNTVLTFFYLAKPDEDAHAVEIKLLDLKTQFSDHFNADYAIYEGQNRLEDLKKVINNQIDELLIVQRGSRLLKDRIFRKFLINELVHEGETPLVILP